MVKDPEGAFFLRVCHTLWIDPLLAEKLLSNDSLDVQFFVQLPGQRLRWSFPLLHFPPGKFPFQRVTGVRAALTGEDLISFRDNAYGNFFHFIKIAKTGVNLKGDEKEGGEVEEKDERLQAGTRREIRFRYGKTKNLV